MVVTSAAIVPKVAEMFGVDTTGLRDREAADAL